MGCGCALVNASWDALAQSCSRVHDAGGTVEFWWRDDDATQAGAAIDRLLKLADRARVPIALAAIADLAQPSLFAELTPYACVLQHGCDHRNRAGPGEKKNEFPAGEAIADALARLAASRERLARLAGARMLPVLVPPWNRLSAALLPHLAAAGFRGLSRYGGEADGVIATGLRQLDTHVDIIDWHGGRVFAGEETVLGQAARAVASAPVEAAKGRGPIGWLTHHACHDEAAWRFLERLFEASRHWPGVRWIAARDYFNRDLE